MYYSSLVLQCGGVSFIENVKADNVNLSREEFNQNMGFVDGRTDVDLLLAEGWEELEQDDENKQVLQVRTV